MSHHHNQYGFFVKQFTGEILKKAYFEIYVYILNTIQVLKRLPVNLKLQSFILESYDTSPLIQQLRSSVMSRKRAAPDFKIEINEIDKVTSITPLH